MILLTIHVFTYIILKTKKWPHFGFWIYWVDLLPFLIFWLIATTKTPDPHRKALFPFEMAILCCRVQWGFLGGELGGCTHFTFLSFVPKEAE